MKQLLNSKELVSNDTYYINIPGTTTKCDKVSLVKNGKNKLTLEFFESDTHEKVVKKINKDWDRNSTFVKFNIPLNQLDIN